LIVASLAMMGRPSTPAELVVWMVVMSFSVLFHELGHALVARAFGYQPAIQLAWLGGTTRPNAPAPIPWHRDVLLTLAGPLFGLMLAGGSYLVLRAVTLTPAARGLMAGTLELNLIWSIFNLVPILPMDGGRISYAVLTRLMGGKGALVAWGLSGLLAGGLAIAAAAKHWLWGAVILGMFAMQASRAFLALRQGASAANDPPELTEARAHLGKGELIEAWRKAKAVVDQQGLSAAVRSRAEHLLGWIALKEGKGRLALDHFSLVSGQRVEREALAAAFSLIGDDMRALPLWELAYREGPNATLLHEWAGTLLRLGRVDEAKRLKSLDLAAAYNFAERVFFLREQYGLAKEAGQTAFELSPSPQRAYDVACACARSGEREEALAWLDKASGLGFSDVAQAERDPDLAPLRGPGFDAWRHRLQESAGH
jgi:Zn-dependent protease